MCIKTISHFVAIAVPFCGFFFKERFLFYIHYIHYSTNQLKSSFSKTESAILYLCCAGAILLS